jgi:hypothetical protein
MLGLHIQDLERSQKRGWVRLPPADIDAEDRGVD